MDRTLTSMTSRVLCADFWIGKPVPTFIALFLLVIPSFAVANDFSSRESDQLRRLDSDVVEIPFDREKDLVIIQALIEGVGRPVRLVIDTGAPTIIREDVANRLGGEPDKSNSVRSASDGYGKSTPLVPLVIPEIRFDWLQFRRIPAVSLRSESFDLFCPPVDGLLGTRGMSRLHGLLEQSTLEIDYDAGLVRIHRVMELGASGDTTLPLRNYKVSRTGEKVNDTVSSVPVMIDGNLVWANLDSGGSGLSEMSLDFFVRLGRSVSEKSVRKYSGRHASTIAGSSSQVDSWLALVRDVKLGSIALGDVPFRIINLPSGGGSAVTLHQHLIGRFNLTLDYQRGEIVLAQRVAVPNVESFPVQVYLDPVKDSLEVAGVRSGGAAERAGLRLGDRIVSIDGDRVANRMGLGACEVTKKLWADGTSVVLTVSRGGREVAVEVPTSESLPQLP